MKTAFGIKTLLGAAVVFVSSAMAQTAFLPIKKVLHFSKTGNYRHTSGIEGCTQALKNLAEKHGFELLNTENGADFLAVNEYDVVILDNNVESGGGGALFGSEAQRQAFVNYVEGGGHVIGFHGATDFDCKGWDWWHLTLFSGNCFKGHDKDPELELDADLMEDPVLSKMWKESGLGDVVAFTGTENYTFKGSTRNLRDDPDVKVLQKNTKKRQSYEDHYFTWVKKIKEGNILYTGLGHAKVDFTQNEAWLEKATWYWMQYLMGAYNPSTTVNPGQKLNDAGLTGEGRSVELFDLSGKLVATHVGAIHEQSEYSQMAKPGLYLAKVRFPSGRVATKKIAIP